MTKRKRVIAKIGAIVLETAAVALGAFSSWLVYPAWLVAWLQKQSPRVLYAIKTSQSVVALTIDDGPVTTASPQILDVLKQFEAQATFFIIADHIPGNEAILERMLSEGHELGNHLTTDRPSLDLSPAEFEAALLRADQALVQFSQPRWFRPGSGWYNREMVQIAAKYRYQTALGSLYPFDPHLPSAWFAAQYILWNVAPGDIIILHDGPVRGERTATALTTVLPELKRRGYRVVTLSELADLRA